MKKTKIFDKSIIILAIILGVIIAMVIFFYGRVRTNSISEAVKREDTLTLAFFIADGEDLLFTEILFYHTGTAKAAILDIPGNTGDVIDSLERMDRIDVLYQRGKPDQYIEKIEQIIDKKIDYFVEVEISAVEPLVDLVEGLEVFIANPVEIIDGLNSILLPSGSVTLDGAKTRLFITYEEPDESDVDRTGRREKFLQGLLVEFGEHADVLTSESVFPYIWELIHTDIQKRGLETFIQEMKRLDSERIVFQRVLGVQRRVDDQVLLFRHYDGELLKGTVKQTLESIANIDIVSDEELNVTLEILNGTTINGLAARTSQVFQSFGYDVVKIGNAEGDIVEKTEVIDRRGDITQAQRVATVIKCAAVRTEVLPGHGDPDENVDVTVILGGDFDGRYCKN